MPVSRVDLADAGSPEKLVTLILKAEPNLPIPVPVEDLCRRLDIIEITPLETDGFEGGLITDSERSNGSILVNQASHPYRRRFTVGHELGHFLIPTHMPDQPGRFLCSRDDMNLLSANESDRRSRMEVEANKFSSLLLIPPPALRASLRGQTPDLEHMVTLAGEYQVSKLAMSRAYAERHPEPVAIVVTRNGKILWSYRDRIKFPFIQPNSGSPVPGGSIYHRGRHQPNVASEMSECLPDNWFEVQRGTRAPSLLEQVYMQRDGYALILLQLLKSDEDEEEEERDLERSWSPRFRR
jgi:Zn-dependent peptidase ImmA (M78 family)